MFYRRLADKIKEFSKEKAEIKNGDVMSFNYKIVTEIIKESYESDNYLRIDIEIWNENRTIELKKYVFECRIREVIKSTPYTDRIMYEGFRRVLNYTQEEWEDMAKKKVLEYLEKNKEKKDFNEMIEKLNKIGGTFTLEEE